MSESRIVYTPHPEATPETEASALASVYRFLLDCHAKAKKNPAAGQSMRGDSDGTEIKEDSARASSIP